MLINKLFVYLSSNFETLHNSNHRKKAGGELLGFCIMLPLVLTMVCAIISAAQIAYTNQTLNYTAYSCARSAVVCENFSDAESRAATTYSYQFKNPQNGGCELELISSSWEKGNFVKCTVWYDIDTLMPFTSGVRTQSIIMMIENGGL